jgi:Xanthine and CO dehydrogenases maturation factor, XdhC/CoxF family
MNLYQRLISSIENRVEVALITVTNINHHAPCHDDRTEEVVVGTKLLLFAGGEVFSERPILNEQWQPLLEEARGALSRQQSKTFVSKQKDFEIEYFVDVYPAPLHLIVAGAGHVARPLVEMGSKLGFYITVICDRPQFANREQFPQADEVVCEPYHAYFRRLDAASKPYITLLTRGHQFDVAILRQILHLPVPYIGMIGSRRRIAGVLSQLHEDYPNTDFEHLYAPVGLDIGAQTPEEIAISVLAEILQVKHHATGSSLRDKIGRSIFYELGEDR